VTQLRIRRKPDPTEQRSAFTLVPVAAIMASIMAAGIGTTMLLDSGKMVPSDAFGAAEDRVAATFASLQQTYLKTQSFNVNGKDWVLAAHPPVEDFQPDEMAPAGAFAGWNLVVNKVRGLSALSQKPSGYDRLYLDLGHGRYAPLRWRHVP
jgi:hypothetical protein